MSDHRIILELLGVPDEHAGLLDDFFSKIRSIIAEIWEFELKQEDIFCFPQFTAVNQSGGVRIFMRYSTTSSALLDLDWRKEAHLRIETAVKEYFQADSVEKIE